MSVVPLSSVALAHGHHDFLSALPAMERASRFPLHRLPMQSQTESIADAHSAT